MQAIIMAGGVGSRLRPLTNDIPKPMVKMINKPVLYYIINLLKRHGFYDIGITLNYKPEIICDYFGNGKDLGVKLHYFIEDEPLGTAGSVKNASEHLADNFLVISGDAFTEIDLSAMLGQHITTGAKVTVAVKEVENAAGFGVVKVSDGVITEFVEKPQKTSEKLVNTGIYVLNKSVLNLIPDGFYDFGKDLFPKMQGQLHAFITSAYWSDIGTLKSYYSTNLYIAEHLANYDFLQ